MYYNTRRGRVSITSHMCLIYNSRIPEQSVAQNSNMYVCVWKRSQEFRNPALVASTHLMCKIRTCHHVCFNFKMQLCMWCRKKAPGIQECLANAPKITCTQFGTTESSGIRIYFCPLIFCFILEKTLPGMARTASGNISVVTFQVPNSQWEHTRVVHRPSGQCISK